MAWLASGVGGWIINEVVVQIVYDVLARATVALARAFRQALQAVGAVIVWIMRRKQRKCRDAGAVSPRNVVVLAIAAVLTIPVEGLVQEPWSTRAPFRDLYAVDGIVTSNDEYRIWLHWTAERFRIQYPDDRAPFEQTKDSEGELAASLSFNCRAAGRAEGLAGPEGARATLQLPMHPDAPNAYHVHPMYWLLGLAGSEVERTPVRVGLPGVPAFDAQLVRRRTDYSFPRPRLRVELPAPAVLELFVAGLPIRIDLAGGGVDARLWFGAQSQLVEPARRIVADCPGLKR